MTGVLVWLRRCTAAKALPALVAVALVMLFSRFGWEYVWLGATERASGSTILLGPLAAGLVAFDVWRRVPAGLRTVVASSGRGPRALLGPVVSTWAYAVAAWATGVVVAAAMAVRHGADEVAVGWFLVHGPVALLAAVSLGAVIGVLLDNVAAAPVAVVVTYCLPIAGVLPGAEGLLTDGGATADLVGLVPDDGIAVTTLVLNAVVAVSLLSLAMARWAVLRTGLALVAGTAGICAVVGTSALASQVPAVNAYEARTDPAVCVGTELVVCGPRGGEALWVIAQRDLSDAWRELAVLGSPPDRGYQFVVGTGPVADGAGLLTYVTGAFGGENLGARDVAGTIATPAACPALFAETPPVDLLTARNQLALWVEARLAGDADPGQDDVARQTYSLLSRCADQGYPAWS